jgi:hypothetical protein
MADIKRLFTPEFRNRLDATVSFKPLDEQIILRVVDKFLLQLEQQLAEKKVEVTFTDKLRKHLAKKGFDPLMGARPMQRLIQDTIRRALADELLFGRLTEGGRLTVAAWTVVAGFVVYYFLGPQRLKKQRLKRLRSRASACMPADVAHAARREAQCTRRRPCTQMAQLGTAACGLPVSSATGVELLSGGARPPSMRSSRRSARRATTSTSSTTSSSPTGSAPRLRDLLVERAREGVQVRLLRRCAGLQAHRAQVHGADAWRPASRSRFSTTPRIGRRLRPVTNYRTHRKIVVCDGRRGRLHRRRQHHRRGRRRAPTADAYHDVHLRIEGSAVRWLQTTFLEDWVYATGERPARPWTTRMPPAMLPDQTWRSLASIPVQIVTSGPDNRLEAIHRMHVAAIQCLGPAAPGSPRPISCPASPP